MPPIGLLLGGVDFKSMYHALDGKTYENMEAAVKAKAPLIAYGMFIQNVVEFFILALVIFLMVRAMNKMRPGVASDTKVGG
jgi:large conductance mechanosensitive channel